MRKIRFNPQTLNSDYDYGDLIPIRELIGCVTHMFWFNN